MTDNNVNWKGSRLSRSAGHNRFSLFFLLAIKFSHKNLYTTTGKLSALTFRYSRNDLWTSRTPVVDTPKITGMSRLSMHVCNDSLAVRTRMERKERDSVRARQWSDVRSPAQRPGFTCARTKINCNQHRCINQIVRRVGSERRIGTVGTGQSSALPLRMICRWHALREPLRQGNASPSRPRWKKKGERIR